MNLGQLFDFMKSRLGSLYPARETNRMVQLILNHAFGFEPIEIRENMNMTVPEDQEIEVMKKVERLVREEPLQYVLGETEFMGHRIQVGPGVLVPRLETEELAEWIMQSEPLKTCQILDIGTGSGCLAIALAHHFSGSRVMATEHSPAALQYAVHNARHYGLDIHFLEHDLLYSPIPMEPGSMDIIVSNPPYVTEGEKTGMQGNVLKWEPPEALFVRDADPLLFYRFIVPESIRLLKPGGMLYLEINERFGPRINDLLSQEGFSDIEVKNDMAGKPRMARGKKS